MPYRAVFLLNTGYQEWYTCVLATDFTITHIAKEVLQLYGCCPPHNYVYHIPVEIGITHLKEIFATLLQDEHQQDD